MIQIYYKFFFFFGGGFVGLEVNFGLFSIKLHTEQHLIHKRNRQTRGEEKDK